MRAAPPPWARAALFGLVLLGLALTTWLADPLPLRKLRLAQFDQFQRWHPREVQAPTVRVVDIDEASLAAFGQWPWPRTRMAELVDRLVQAGAAVVAFDVILAEPDRTSPATVLRTWQAPGLEALAARLPDHDAVFAQALRGRPVVLGASLAREGELAGRQPSTDAPPPHRLVARGGDPLPWLQPFENAVWPLPALLRESAGTGALNLAADDDGVVRRVPLLLRLGDRVVPSLAAEALRVAQGARNFVTTADAAGVHEVRVGRHAAPTNAQGELWLHYSADVPGRFVPAVQVLRGGVAPGAWQGQVVLVGSSAAGLMDLRASPRGHLMPGVLAHATALEQVLVGRYLQRPPATRALEALLLLAACGAIAGAALAWPVRKAVGVAVAVMAALAAATWGAFTQAGWLVDAATPALAGALVFMAASGARHWHTERQQRWLRTAFARYVSPNRVEHLVRNPDMLNLGGQRQDCSFVFTDLAGFTALMERSDPGEAVARLNEYLDGMLAIVFRHEGTLDRIVGDAIAVLFSAPVPQADHRQRALACALELHAFARDHAARLRAAGIAWGDTRIGVHSGEVIVGNFGGSRMFDYRALGDAVNTASRLEAANKHLGTRLLVSEALLQGCTGVPVRRVGRLLLQGKQQPVGVATPEAALDAVTCAPAGDYGEAFALMVTQPDGAAALARFTALAAAAPGDPLVALHLARLQAGASGDLIVLDRK